MGFNTYFSGTFRLADDVDVQDIIRPFTNGGYGKRGDEFELDENEDGSFHIYLNSEVANDFYQSGDFKKFKGLLEQGVIGVASFECQDLDTGATDEMHWFEHVYSPGTPQREIWQAEAKDAASQISRYMSGIDESKLADVLLQLKIDGTPPARVANTANESSAMGSIGKHDWCLGAKTEDGYLVFVDDRPLSYKPTANEAKTYALEIIDRLIADGDYRLNDRPAGFLPPALVARKLTAHSNLGL